MLQINLLPLMPLSVNSGNSGNIFNVFVSVLFHIFGYFIVPRADFSDRRNPATPFMGVTELRFHLVAMGLVLTYGAKVQNR